MKKNLAIAAVAVFLLAAPSLRAEETAHVEDLVIQTQSGAKHAFKVEIADTMAKAELGLMYRKSMAEDHGMLFEFPGPPRPVAFWMKNTFIPLDMLFVGQKGDIVTVAANAVPQSLAPIPSGPPVTGVIELNGGETAKLDIKAGDKVLHPFFK